MNMKEFLKEIDQQKVTIAEAKELVNAAPVVAAPVEEVAVEEVAAVEVLAAVEVDDKAPVTPLDKLGLAKLLARLDGFKINIKTLQEDWILLTYDLPVGEEGNKARYKFLSNVSRLGAVMHTRSVYLMPLTDDAQTAAFELSKTIGGKAFIWTSKVTDPVKAKELTDFYDQQIYGQVVDIRERIKLIREHRECNRHGMADRMVKKTVEIFNSTLFAVSQRGSNWLMNQLRDIEPEIREVM